MSYVQDFQAFCIFLVRYLTALTPPAASRPDTACLVLETITFRLRIFCMHLLASSLEQTTTSSTTRPEKCWNLYIINESSGLDLLASLYLHRHKMIFMYQSLDKSWSLYQIRSLFSSLPAPFPFRFL